MLRSIHAVAAAAVVAAALAAGDAAQAGQPVLTIVNASGHELRQLYLSVFDTRVWSPDALEETVLAPDQSLAIPLDAYGDACSFNVMAIDELGRSLEVWDYDICARGTTIAIDGRPLVDGTAPVDTITDDGTLPDFFSLPSG